MNETLKWALRYIERGWAVFPLHSIDDEGICTCGNPTCSDAGKHPRGTYGVKEASRDKAQIEQWFGDNAPRSNIAIATGAASNLTTLDIDIGVGKFGAESWAEAIEGHGEPDTLTAKTGSGGLHTFFQYNSALKTAANVLGKGVDVRNDQGYVVAAPSRHRSGGVYEWEDWDKPVVPLPAHLSRRKETRGRKKKNDMYNGKYSIEQVRDMLDVVPADDRDLWRHVGIILGRFFDRNDDAWELYNDWANKFGGKKGRNHDQIMHEAFYEISQASNDNQLSIGTIVKAAMDNGWVPKAGEVPIGNFLFYGPGNNYIYRPTTSLWVAPAVNAAVSPVNVDGKLIKASEWLMENQLVTSMTSDPSMEDDYVKGYDCRDGEVIECPGAALFNTYRRPTIELGDAKLSQPFLNHVYKIFDKPGDADQFLDYMAHRVQKPWEKPRFALLIAGGQGVGKDTAVEFCSPAIGAWNVSNVEPSVFDTNYNEYIDATLVRISEAANLHDMSKWAFNERTKVLIAGQPDFVSINPKYGQKYSMRMYCGVIITTNHLMTGIYIPEDDRRYDVIDCASMEDMGLEDLEARKEYFTKLYDWFLDEDGANHVAAYLHERDISNFHPATGQRRTKAHGALVRTGNDTDDWLEEILEQLGKPEAIREDWVFARLEANGEEARKFKRKLKAAMLRGGYVKYDDPESRTGRWMINKKLVSIYVKAGFDVSDFNPAKELASEAF